MQGQQMQPDHQLYYKQLVRHKFRDLKAFTFKGLLTPARVTRLYDGDTAWIAFFHDQRPVLHPFRMAGYNSPEMRPRLTVAHRSLHMAAAKVATERLGALLRQHANDVVWVRFMKEEKYGRLMGRMYIPYVDQPWEWRGDEACVNTWMVQNDYGKAYFGGRKMDFTKGELESIVAREEMPLEPLELPKPVYKMVRLDSADPQATAHEPGTAVAIQDKDFCTSMEDADAIVAAVESVS